MFTDNIKRSTGIDNQEITKDDIRKRILKLNTNKSPGPDNMHPPVVKELTSVIVDPFYFVFDLSPKNWEGSFCMETSINLCNL